MGLGGSKRVDLDKYFQALEIFAGRQGVGKIKKEIGDYGIAGTVTVYTGSEYGDGEVTIPFTYEGVKGFLRFNKNGYIYEGLKSRDSVGSVPSGAAELFIGGLFGRSEISSSSQSEYIGALLSNSSACWIEGSKGYCNMDGLTSAKKSIEEAKEVKAEARAESNRVAAEQQRQAEVSGYIRKGNDIWTKAQQLINLAEKCDDGPFGIDTDDLREIRNDYLTNKNMPTNLEEAKAYYEIAKDMFGKMVMNSSGYECIEERGEEIGCSYSYSSSGIHDDCGPGYEGGHYTYSRTVSCPEINFEELRSGNGGGCKEKLIHCGKGC